MAETTPPAWRVALTLRWTVLRRRFVSPLEATILLVVSLLAYLVGKELGTGGPLLGVACTAVCAAAILAGSRPARRLLYGARELALLIPSGLSPRLLVRLRGIECAALWTCAALPLLALLAGTRVSAGEAPSPLLLLAAPVYGLGIGSAALLLAWAGSAARRPLAVLGVLLVAATVAGAVLRPTETVALFAHDLGPGGSLVGLAAGRLLWTPLAGAALLAVLADRLVARGYAKGIDRAAQRAVVAYRRFWPACRSGIRPLCAPLSGSRTGQVATALLTRDVALLVRGAFPRGVVILSALPFSLGVVFAASRDAGTEGWHLRLMGLLLAGVLGAAAGFLFGVDYPRARRGQLLLVRTQPVRARAVLISRWVPAVLYCALLVAGIAAIAATSPEPRLAAEALSIGLNGLLVVLITSHHAVTYGMRSEAQLDPAEAAAYPLNGGVVVVLFAFALALHPLAALAYPLVWFGFARAAMRRWELAEVESMHQAAA